MKQVIKLPVQLLSVDTAFVYKQQDAGIKHLTLAYNMFLFYFSYAGE